MYTPKTTFYMIEKFWTKSFKEKMRKINLIWKAWKRKNGESKITRNNKKEDNKITDKEKLEKINQYHKLFEQHVE